MNQINSDPEKQPGPSKLENAAKVLGIVTNLANAGATAYKAFGTDPKMLEEMIKKNQADALIKK